MISRARRLGVAGGVGANGGAVGYRTDRSRLQLTVTIPAAQGGTDIRRCSARHGPPC
jgi:hypothetical protein